MTLDWDQAHRTYLQYLLGGQRSAACNLTMSMREQGHRLVDIYVEILEKSMVRVGELWESHRISVAVEHRATIITQFVMAQLFPTIKLPIAPKSKIIVTGVEGEMHQLGANMVADVLEEEGHLVQFLGTNLPTSCVVDLVEKQLPDLLGISATMLFSLPTVANLVESVRDRLGPRAPQILLGGTALRETPEFAKHMGCHRCTSDLRGALALVRWATRTTES